MPFELTILGSSSALPTSERYPTAQVLNVLERFFLIDCGEGAQIQLRRLKLKMGKIRHIFISHLHGDHYFGLPGLISTLKLLGYTNDIHIYAHSELQGLIKPQLDNMKGGLGFNVIFHPLNLKKPQVVYSCKKVEVSSFPVNHSIPTCGFLFKEQPRLPNIKKELIKRYKIPIKEIQAIKEGAGFIAEGGKLISHAQLTTPPPKPRSYAFCTDTRYHEPIVEIIKGADLLYHEATFLDEMRELAGQTFHSTARQAATIAMKANVGKLIIGHFSARYKDITPLADEARQVFPETYAAHDGDVFRVARLSTGKG